MGIDQNGSLGALGGCLLALAVLAPYAGSLQSGFIYDDHEVVLGQPAPRSLGDLAQLFAEPHFRGLPYYRPVVRATLLGQKALHGDRPLLFHAVNVALAALVALAARALLRRPAFGVAPAPAWLAAALFAVHPVASSTVYPIASGRETLLPALCVLLTVWAWLGGTPRARALALLAFAGALFGKEASVVTPALLVLADALRLTPDAPTSGPVPWLVRYAPMAAVLALYLVIRTQLFAGGEYRLALLEAPLGPLQSVAYALQSIVAPPRALAYEPELAVWLSPLRLALALAVGAVLAMATWRGGVRARRAGLFWLAWFVLSLLPTANVLRQEAPFDERYVFLASLAPMALAAAWLSRTIEGSRGLASRRVALAAAGALVLAAGVVSAGRAPAFRDDEAFARQWLRTNPRSAEAHHALGLTLVRSGRTLEGQAHYVQALALDPDFLDAHTNLGVSLAAEGRLQEARTHFEATLRLAPDHPEAHNDLGLVLAAEGRLAEAVAQYEQALAAEPRFPEAHNNLGTALARLGDVAGAERHLEAALALAPGYTEAQRNLAIVRARLARELR